MSSNDDDDDDESDNETHMISREVLMVRTRSARVRADVFFLAAT